AERPADIVRKRLELAGYDIADGLNNLGEDDLSFLLKFMYKSTALGPAEEDMIFTDYKNVDLTNKSLRTVPVVLYNHAEDIKSLTLSCNPMLDIPGDFVRLCTTLKELHMSNMSIKKVPQSVQNFVTLTRLDLSSNRIGDITDLSLYRLPDLQELRVQNNRMKRLPWYLPRLRMLRLLNISNNKFQDIPEEVCKMSSLEELDVSFNRISQLPENMQSWHRLKVLIIVGNRVRHIPDSFQHLSSLTVFDCRRNEITWLGAVSLLPNLEELLASHNGVLTVDLSSGPLFKKIHLSHNDITQISLAPGPVGRMPVALTYLNVTSAKLSSLDDLALGQLTSLEELILDRNKLRAIPESLGELSLLQSFSCSDNLLGALPSSIGRLQKLERLDMHNNNLTEFPAGLWSCGSLEHINMASNLVAHTRLPALHPAFSSSPAVNHMLESALSSTVTLVPTLSGRRASLAGSVTPSRPMPPLVKSLQRLYLSENRLTDDALPFLMILRELRVLNLSFNDIQELPRQFFKEIVLLEELYLGGNKLAGLPTEDLPRLSKLKVLYLNGNRLVTLPQELGKVINLAVLDVGSNGLRYNIGNWEFDWNWNFNKNLKYLNLSGNKHLRIQTWQRQGDRGNNELLHRLAGFQELNQLRVLGLMDVTTTHAVNVPDDTEDRRVRTSVTLVNQLQYGLADNLGNREYLSMFDLVLPAFRESREEAIFAMFGRSHASPHNTRISKFLHDNFVQTFTEQLKALDLSKGESHADALRRTFLMLNRLTHDHLFSAHATNASGRKTQARHRSSSTLFSTNADAAGVSASIGASGIVAYFRGHHLFVANAGNALAVVSRRGQAHIVSVKHEPFDRNEIMRIRAAEGWVSPNGLVNDEADVSRSFGYYRLLPIVNARPDITSLKLSELDEFLIIANNGLWDFVTYQTAVDIARSERGDPMIAAQKLRDFAVSYGSEGTTMIMVISLAGMFAQGGQEDDYPLQDLELFQPPRRNRNDEVGDNETGRLGPEILPPTGQVVLAFTDIVNSTRLWDVNETAMRTAVTMHHQLLRRHVRLCGGYEVKTEGDAFTVAFTTVSAALLWCSSVQIFLLDEPWPKEILDLPEGREVHDAKGTLIARGLSLRMGIHYGTPVCEMNLVSRRMAYYGTMVNRASRVASSAAGGQILLSADALHELEVEKDSAEPQLAEALLSLELIYINVGERKLKGLEIPEVMTAAYPLKLLGRLHMPAAVAAKLALLAPMKVVAEHPIAEESAGAAFLGIECCWTPSQVRELAQLAVRLQTLASGRVFRALPVRKESRIAPADADSGRFLYGDLGALIPTVSEHLSEAEVLSLLDFLSIQLELAVESLAARLDAPSVLRVC
ncbi:Protein phosphatase 2C domain containing protein, partial [Lactarius tabidus]